MVVLIGVSMYACMRESMLMECIDTFVFSWMTANPSPHQEYSFPNAWLVEYPTVVPRTISE